MKMAWLLISDGFVKFDNKQLSIIDSSMVKAEVTEIALEVVQWSMQVHGAAGYSKELDLEERLRDIYGLRIADGTTDVLRSQVARSKIGNQIYNMSLGR